MSVIREKSKNPRARNWCFTWNNYPADFQEQFKNNLEWIEYYCFGEEVGESGTPHLQGVLKCKTQMYRNSIFSKLKINHLEVMRGTWEQAITYCKKDGKITEWGVLPKEQTQKATERNQEKYEEALELAKAGKVSDISAELQIRYYSTLNKIASDTANLKLPEDLDWIRGKNCPNEWIWGPHNTGKSKTARSENPGFYTKMMNDLWEGYDYQDVVVLEDFDPFHKKLGYDLKIWADRYAFRGRKLYGSLVLRPKKIVVTSQYHPKDIWDDKRTVDAICDRFVLREMTVDPFYEEPAVDINELNLENYVYDNMEEIRRASDCIRPNQCFDCGFCDECRYTK